MWSFRSGGTLGPGRRRVCGGFFFQAEDGIRDSSVTGVQTCALPIYPTAAHTIGAWCRDQRGYALIGLGETTRATVETQLAGFSTLPPPSTISPQPHLGGLSGSKLDRKSVV